MVRKAREKSEYGIYYVHQNSQVSSELFRSDEDRLYFIKLLEDVKSHFQFDLIAYCVLNSNAYHLVLQLRGSDLSQIMKSLNIGYAIYRKAEGKIYKDRYKSQVLKDTAEVNQLLEKLKVAKMQSSLATHETPVIHEWQQFCQVNLETCDCKDCIKSLQEAEAYLAEACASMQLSKSELIRDKSVRNQYIIEMRKRSTLSLKDIGDLFGGISESSVCKIIKDCP